MENVTAQISVKNAQSLTNCTKNVLQIKRLAMWPQMISNSSPIAKITLKLRLFSTRIKMEILKTQFWLWSSQETRFWTLLLLLRRESAEHMQSGLPVLLALCVLSQSSTLITNTLRLWLMLKTTKWSSAAQGTCTNTTAIWKDWTSKMLTGATSAMSVWNTDKNSSLITKLSELTREMTPSFSLWSLLDL
jgi:hypothetical protein